MSAQKIPEDPEQYELTTDEGVQYAPEILIERDETGRIFHLEVGLNVTLPETDAAGNHVSHTTTLIPSTSTGEGTGHGNVFWYEDGDALSHIAWHPSVEFGVVTGQLPQDPHEDDGLSRRYHAYREAYWEAQRQFRAATVVELQAQMPAHVHALLFDMSDDIAIPRLRLDGWWDEDGADHDTWELEECGAYDRLDQLASDVEAFSWEEAESFLSRTDDGKRFIVRRQPRLAGAALLTAGAVIPLPAGED